MDVVCPKCSTHHRAEPPSSLRSRGAVRFRCTHCGNTFKVEFPGEGGAVATMTLAPAARTEQSMPPAAAPAAPVRGYTVRAEGEIYPTTDLATLQRWILECRVKPDDQLSIDGERWERAGDRADFELFFAAAERLHVPAAPAPVRPASAPPPEDPLGFDSARVDGPSRDDEDVVAALGASEPDDSVVESVDETWGERTQALPESAAEDIPRIEPDEVTRVSGGGYAEPDTQEATMLSVLQERTEEVRKGPVPVRRGYTSLTGQKSLPPGAPPPAPLLPQSMQEMAAEFDTPKPRPVERHAEPEFGDDDDPVAPPENPAVRALIGVVVVATVALLCVAGWWISHPDSPPPVASNKPAEVASAPVAPPPAPVAEPAAVEPAAVAPPADPAVAAAQPVTPAPAPAAQRPPDVEPVKPAVTPVAAPKPVAVAPAPAPASTTSAPLSANDAVKKGWGLVNKGKYSEAFDVFSKALQKSPGNGSLLYGRGYANEKLGDDVSAAADYCDARSAAVSEDTRRELDGALGRLRRTCP